MKPIICLSLILFAIMGLKAQNVETEKAEPLVRGAYNTFQEFVANSPSFIDSFYVKSKARIHPSWVGTFSLAPKLAKNNKSLKGLWGFCDGEQAYILHQDEYFPVIKDNNQYLFIGYDLTDEPGYEADLKAQENQIIYRIDESTGVPIHPEIYQKLELVHTQEYPENSGDTATSETSPLEPLVRGAYKNFHEFMTNSPSLIDSFYVSAKERTHPSWTGTFSLTPKLAENNKTISTIWGFCDGKQAYISYQEEYFTIVKKNNQYLFTGYDRAKGSGNKAEFKAQENKTLYEIDLSLGVPIHPEVFRKPVAAKPQEPQETDDYYNSTVTPETLVRGAYKTYQEFVTNSPSITEDFYVKKKARTHKSWLGTYSLKPKFVSNNKRIKHIWGFSDGNQAYILHQAEFFPIMIENDQYSFIGFDIIDDSGAIATGLLFGLVGAGIHTSISESKARTNKTIYTIEPSMGLAVHPIAAPDSLAIGMQIGPEEMLAIETHVIFYRMGKKELDSPVEFIVDDSLTYSFYPDSFLALKFKKDQTFMKVCYGSGFAQCIEIVRNVFEDSYVLCTLPEKGREPLLSLQKHSKGEFDSYKPRKAQRKRDKALLKGK